MTRIPTLDDDYLEREIDEVIRRLEAKDIRNPERETVAEVILQRFLTPDWKEIVAEAKAELFYRNDRCSFHGPLGESNVDFELLTKAGQSKMRGRLVQSGAAEDSPVVRALGEWPGGAVRPHKKAAILQGVPCVHWVQESNFLGSRRIGWTRIPIVICQLRLNAIFPFPKKEPALLHQIPEVRIELLQSATRASEQETAAALTEILSQVATNACCRVASQLTDAGESVGPYDFHDRSWPMRLVIGVPEGMRNLAAACYERLTDSGAHSWPLTLQDNLADEDVALMGMKCVESSSLAQPLAKEKSTARKSRAKPDAPGDEFLLMEFSLNSAVVCKNGCVDAAYRLDRYRNFVNEYGNKPEAMLASAGVEVNAIPDFASYDELTAYLEEAADSSRWRVEDIRRAVSLAGTSVAHRNQPVIRLLIDLATGVHSVSVNDSKESMQSFLDRETSGGSRLGAKPKAIKLSRTLLASHNDVAAWAAKHDVTIIHPTSGADAGAKYVRLWNKVATDVLTAYERGNNWWGSKPVSFAEWKAGCQEAAKLFCGDQADKNAENNCLAIFLPKSLFVGEKEREAFAGWKAG